jgi:methionyl aminopeptidase
MFYKGYHTDFATSFIVGALSNDKITDFLKTGKQTLINAIASAKAGNRLGHISDTIEKGISGSGYFILKELTGHGIGKTLHEDPYVFGFNEKPINKTMLIKPGLTIAIEVIYSLGTEEIVHEKNNNWSIITADMTMSACFEHTIAITENKTLIIT